MTKPNPNPNPSTNPNLNPNPNPNPNPNQVGALVGGAAAAGGALGAQLCAMLAHYEVAVGEADWLQAVCANDKALRLCGGRVPGSTCPETQAPWLGLGFGLGLELG